MPARSEFIQIESEPEIAVIYSKTREQKEKFECLKRNQYSITFER